MIRNGRGLMPTYNRIEESDRWDVVNYVRGLQGKLGHAVLTGPLGAPGETGAKLPGATLTGPTQPSRYRPTAQTTAVPAAAPAAAPTAPAPTAAPAARDSAARRNPGAQP